MVNDDAPTEDQPRFLDRKLQREVLEACRMDFPQFCSLDNRLLGEDPARVSFQCFYLADYGLIETKAKPNERPWPACRITAAGLDYLEQDGGLGAILGVVTIRFDDDTLRALLIDRVQQAPVDPSIKGALVARIRELPAEALKTATMEFVKAGVATLALPAIKAIVGA